MVELVAEKVVLLNTVAKSLPMKVSGTEEENAAVAEETRLKHRVLDLRRPKMVRPPGPTHTDTRSPAVSRRAGEACKCAVAWLLPASTGVVHDARRPRRA